MDPTRFDRFAQSVGREGGPRLTRRAALAAGAAGLAAVGLSRGSHGPAAQEATPAASPVASPVASPMAGDTGAAFLFVQLAEGGTWAPKPGAAGVYLLSLAGPGAQTLYFSDRPARVVGTVPTDRFLGALGFTPNEPPNAAVVVQTADGAQDALVVELFNPVYTRTVGADGGDALTYEARVLGEYQGEGLAAWVPDATDDRLPQEFSNVSLFIDDCSDAEGCYADKRPPGSAGSFKRVYIGPIPGGPYGRCYNWYTAKCELCDRGAWNRLNALCNDAYPGTDQCFGMCYHDTCRWGGTC